MEAQYMTCMDCFTYGTFDVLAGLGISEQTLPLTPQHSLFHRPEHLNAMLIQTYMLITNTDIALPRIYSPFIITWHTKSTMNSNAGAPSSFGYFSRTLLLCLSSSFLTSFKSFQAPHLLAKSSSSTCSRPCPRQSNYCQSWLEHVTYICHLI